MRLVTFVALLVYCFCSASYAEPYNPRKSGQWAGEHTHPFPLACDSVTTAAHFIAVDIKTQHMACYENGKLIRVMDVCTGAPQWGDKLGSWTVDKKKPRAISYWPANEDDPEGPRYVMRWAVSIGDHYWMHKGVLPGYPASHGCVRLSEANAKWLYNWVKIGDTGYSYEEAATQMTGAMLPKDNPLAIKKTTAKRA